MKAKLYSLYMFVYIAFFGKRKRVFIQHYAYSFIIKNVVPRVGSSSSKIIQQRSGQSDKLLCHHNQGAVSGEFSAFNGRLVSELKRMRFGYTYPNFVSLVYVIDILYLTLLYNNLYFFLQKSNMKTIF